MTKKSAFGVVVVCLLCSLRPVSSAVGTACPNGDECTATGEVCNLTPECECDSANGYQVDSGDATLCALRDCNTIDPPPAGYDVTGTTTYGGTASVACATGYGGTAAAITCQADGTWDAFSGCTLNDCTALDPPPAGYDVTGTTTYGGAASVACATGYGGTAAAITCQADGTWDAFSGCTLNDCNVIDPPPAGYDVTGTTTYGGTANVACATGYGGTAAAITCQADGTWDAFSGCTLNDCSVSDTAPAGYDVSGTTTYGGSPVVACANGYSGTAAAITCQADGTWTAFSGCTSNGVTGIDLGNACSTTPECTAGNGGAGSVCSTDCICDSNNNYVANGGTCKKDCGNPTESAGYTLAATPGSTVEGATATVQCATGYTGTAASITCQSSGTWTAFSGCTASDGGCKLGFSYMSMAIVITIMLLRRF